METEKLFSNGGVNQTHLGGLKGNTVAGNDARWAFENNPLKEKLKVSPNIRQFRVERE